MAIGTTPIPILGKITFLRLGVLRPGGRDWGLKELPKTCATFDDLLAASLRCTAVKESSDTTCLVFSCDQKRIGAVDATLRGQHVRRSIPLTVKQPEPMNSLLRADECGRVLSLSKMP